MLKKCISGTSLGLVFLGCINPVFALQVVDASDGKSHMVTISKNELTRISAENSRIRRIDFVGTEISVEKDEVAGHAFIRPNVDKLVNIFVTTDTNTTHALILQPKDVPLENIVLQERKNNPNLGAFTGARERTVALEAAVRNLVIAMARDERITEYDQQPVNQEVSLWKEALFVLKSRYNGRQLRGEKYILTNASQTIMRLAEQELYKKGVVAVAVEQLTLNPGESTWVFVVSGVEQ